MGFATDERVRAVHGPGAAVRADAGRQRHPLTKFWFSVTAVRAADPVHHPAGRPGPAVEALADRPRVPGQVGRLHRAKEAMFLRTDTDHAPWTTVKSNDKKRARLNAMRALPVPVRLRGQGPGRRRAARPAHRGAGPRHRRGLTRARSPPREPGPPGQVQREQTRSPPRSPRPRPRPPGSAPRCAPGSRPPSSPRGAGRRRARAAPPPTAVENAKAEAACPDG